MSGSRIFSGYDVFHEGNTSWKDIQSKLSAIQSVHATLGFSNFHSTRIGAYSDVLKELKHKSDSEQPVGQHLAVRLLNAMVEFQQITKILEAFHSSSKPLDWMPRLQQLFRSAEFPNKESHSKSARDSQFESFIGAVFELSGFEVQFAEPDIIIADGLGQIGIAAKRPRNEQKIERNCMDASKQIIRSGIKGVIAIDLSFAMHVNQCLNCLTLADCNTWLEHESKSLVNRHHKLFEKACKHSDVLGVLVHLHVPVIEHRIALGPRPATAIRWTIAPFPSVANNAVCWAMQYVKSCSKGLFGESSMGGPDPDSGLHSISYVRD